MHNVATFSSATLRMERLFSSISGVTAAGEAESKGHADHYVSAKKETLLRLPEATMAGAVSWRIDHLQARKHCIDMIAFF